jgi:two-component system NarL family sensor kinase
MLRSQVSRLTPAILDQAGLVAAIRRVADDAAQRGRFSCEVDATSWPGHTTAVDRLFYDCAREFLANVAKHAEARSAHVTLSHGAASATLVVTDDGRGTDSAHRQSQLRDGHIGLATRRIRVEAAGGEMTIHSSPSTGTTVTVTVPVSVS